MSFRLIRNRAQQIAIIGFLATLVVSLFLSFFNIPAYITLPFLMVWIMVWFLGLSGSRKNTDNQNDK